MTRCRSFAPIAAEDARVLILGSMPSQASLQAQQYYAHPYNQFWPLIYEVLEMPLPVAYKQRTDGLKKSGVALWDVLAYCEREGSLDSAITNERPNDFAAFLARHSHIKNVFFNGTKARDMWKKHIRPTIKQELRYHTLPSTSPAHARAFALKLEKWVIIREVL